MFQGTFPSKNMALNPNSSKISSVTIVNIIHFLTALQMDILDFGTEAILASVGEQWYSECGVDKRSSTMLLY